MDTLTAIETRRTIKTFLPAPVPRDVLERVLGAARWAPNHRLTEPWRFRVIGPEALDRLCEVAGAGADKLRTSPVLIAVSYVPSPLPPHAVEDEQATAAAIYAVLLAAHAEGLASFWRSPKPLAEPAGRAAVGMPESERAMGLVYLGYGDGDAPEPPERRELSHYVTYLD